MATTEVEEQRSNAEKREARDEHELSRVCDAICETKRRRGCDAEVALYRGGSAADASGVECVWAV
jgi:hypothetical protein